MSQPIAHVADNGYVTPITKYSAQSLKFMSGRFIYSKKELDEALAHWEKVTTDLRSLADSVGDKANAGLLDHEFDSTDDLVQALAEEERETVPTMDNPSGKRGKTKKSKAVVDPYLSQAPDTLSVPQENINLTPEEQANMPGVDTNKAMQELFGAK